MLDTKSDFALNKLDREAIVCKSVTGVHIRLTREDFASEEEFLSWKKLSESDYKDRECAGRDFYDNCISLVEAWYYTGTSAEDVMLAPLLKAEQEQQRMALIQQVKHTLTEKQYRRLCLYYLKNMTEAEIAAIEGVGQQRISVSLSSGVRALKKILKNF